MHQRILVTGSSGFVARVLLPILSNKHNHLIGIDRVKPESKLLDEIYIGDIARRNVLAELTPPINKIVHLAAQVYECRDSSCMTHRQKVDAKIQDFLGGMGLTQDWM